MYIDTHSHLNYENKYGDTDKLLAEIAAAGIEKIIDVGGITIRPPLPQSRRKNTPPYTLRRGFTLPTSMICAPATMTASPPCSPRPKGWPWVRSASITITTAPTRRRRNAPSANSWNLPMRSDCPSASTAAMPRPIRCKYSKTTAQSSRTGRDALFFGQPRNGERVPETRAVHFVRGAGDL